MRKIKNITRMEYDPPHGWWVRFSYNKKQYSKFFNDKKYGGKQSALLSAVAWMKNAKKKANIPDTHLFVCGGARSNTGVKGVSYCASSNSYFASWYDANGRPAATSYSANKHGKKKAFAMACKKREKMEQWRLAGNTYIVDEYYRKSTSHLRKFTREQLIEILQKKEKELGRVPRTRDFANTRPTHFSFRSVFGTWASALAAAGIYEDDYKADNKQQAHIEQPSEG